MRKLDFSKKSFVNKTSRKDKVRDMKKSTFKKLIKGTFCMAFALAAAVMGTQMPELLKNGNADSVFKIAKAETAVPKITYMVNVQNNGWTDIVKGGQIAGTTGKSLGLRGLKINLAKGNKSMIKYRTHVSNIGWQSWMPSGNLAGANGNLLEGIQINLLGEYADQYDIYYRVHVPYFGWLGYTKNGALAGSTGLSLRIEAIQIELVKKNQAFQVNGVSSVTKPSLSYQAHSQNIGWMGIVSESTTAGTVGRGYRLEGLIIKIGNGGISYRAHVSDIGWQTWKTSGQLMGTTGQGKAIEAVEMRLTGNLSDYYDIYYRMHVAGFGWLGWAKNGEPAGTTGSGIQAEAIQIQLVVKSNSIDRQGTAYYASPAANRSQSNSDSFASLRTKYPNNSLWTGSYFGKAWQCHGFALTLGYERTGTDPYGWSKVYNLNSLKPGDIIRCGRPHTIMVTGVSGNTITYVDCNWVAKNKVRWDQTIQRQQITSKFGRLTYVMVSPK